MRKGLSGEYWSLPGTQNDITKYNNLFNHEKVEKMDPWYQNKI